jgi:ComF family protein
LPRKERVIRIEAYNVEDIPVSPVSHEACGVEITTLLNYRDEVVQDLVKALKYDRAGGAAKLLADALAEYLREEIANLKAFSTKPIVLMPVPLHASRLRERGFNQVEKVLLYLPDEFKNGELSHVDSLSLVRTRATPQQTRLSRGERLTNVTNAFALAHPLEDAHVIIIDDVTTTGATLTESARPLSGKTVTLLALAHA